MARESRKQDRPPKAQPPGNAQAPERHGLVRRARVATRRALESDSDEHRLARSTEGERQRQRRYRISQVTGQRGTIAHVLEDAGAMVPPISEVKFNFEPELPMGLKTPLYQTHLDAAARMVDFGGWDMPVHYGSQIEEHHAVRRDAGMFDVSHMLIADVHGAQARDYLRHLLANDVAKLKAPGKALYSCMLNEHGGVVDDLIVYRSDDEHYRVVVNAGTRDKDVAWLLRHVPGFEVEVRPRTDLAMLAIQGPAARAKVAPLLGGHGAAALELNAFFGRQLGQYFVARTGYTGEDGWEVMLPAAAIAAFWSELRAAGIAACGLGARDTLRLEAGMNLYGNDMDEQRTPLESGLTWTVAFDPAERNFVGRAALEAQRTAGVAHKLVGVVLEERGVLRSHQRVVIEGVGEGELTSGTFSPTLQRSIGFARVPAATGERVTIDIRGKLLAARVVKYPFVRNGHALI